jgi:hypothetical protein
LNFSISCCNIPLLLARHLLESVEFFSVELVEFGIDVYGGLACV